MRHLFFIHSVTQIINGVEEFQRSTEPAVRRETSAADAVCGLVTAPQKFLNVLQRIADCVTRSTASLHSTDADR